MALRAIARAEVLFDRNAGDLSPLRGTVRHLVAFVAACRVVIAVPENISEVVLGRQGAIVRGESVADAARTDLAFGGVATVAIIVCLKTARNGLTGPGRPMTRRTSVTGTTGSAVMVAVVELHIEALFEFLRKFKHIRWCRRVAYPAKDLSLFHHLGIGPLAQMTSYTRIVACKFHIERAPLAAMTRRTLKFFVLLDLV